MLCSLSLRSGCLVSVCSLFVSVWAVADESATIDIPLVDENVRQLVQDQDWKAAIAAIDKALRQEDAPQDRLT